MPVGVTLDELVTWLAGKLAPEEPPAPKPLTREAWHNVHNDLAKASTALLAVETQLEDRTALAEFARDVAREAEDLSLRAEVLGGTAPHRPPAQGAAHTRTAPHEPHATAAKPPAEPEPEPERKPEPLPKQLDAIQKTLQAAGRNLVSEAPLDADAQAFSAQFDVVVEMLLMLREEAG